MPRHLVPPAGRSGLLAPFLVVLSLAMQPAPAQVPPGWAVVSSFYHQGTGMPGGLQIAHPAVPGAPIPITGLPTQLTGPAPGGFVQGAGSVLVDPVTGNVIVGEHAPPGQSTDIHVLTLNGTFAASSRAYTIGTSPNGTGSVDQMAWLGQDIVFAVRGGNFPSGAFRSQLVGILRPSLGPPGTPGTVIPVPITANPPGTINALTVDEVAGIAYFAKFNGVPGPTVIYSLAVPGPGTPVTPTTVATLNATVLNMAFRNGKILFAGFDPNGTYLAEIDPQTNPATVTLLPTGTLGTPNGIVVETATGQLLIADESNFTLERYSGGVHLQMASPLTGAPSGVSLNPSLVTYGMATPGANSYEWSIAPNAGGLPTVGNTSFAIALSSSPGIAPGVLALSLGSGNVPLPAVGITLLLDPTTLVIQGLLPAASMVSVPIPIPAVPAFAGFEVFAQAGYFEPAGIATSDGLRISVF